MMASPLIQLVDLSRTYASQERVDPGAQAGPTNGNDTVVIGFSHVSTEIGTSELVALTGPSGCGKTTLLNVMGLVDRPTSGDVIFEGRSTRSLSDHDRTLIRRLRIGYVFQFFHLLPHLDLIQNIELPLLLDGVDSTTSRRRAQDLLTRVGLGTRGADTPHQLSGGQMQRVAIARALIADPPLILADEPTGSLDTRTGHDILTIFKELVWEGRTVIIATHSESAAAIATRRIRLRDGHVLTGSDHETEGNRSELDPR